MGADWGGVPCVVRDRHRVSLRFASRKTAPVPRESAVSHPHLSRMNREVDNILDRMPLSIGTDICVPWSTLGAMRQMLFARDYSSSGRLSCISRHGAA